MQKYNINEFKSEMQDVAIKAIMTSNVFDNVKNNVKAKIAKLPFDDQLEFMEFVPHILELNRNANINFNTDTFRHGFAHNINLDFGIAFTPEEIDYIVQSNI